MFDSFKAMSNVQNIKNGGTCELSLSQIVNINFNISKAKQNLSYSEFNEFQNLFNCYKADKSKHLMDLREYLSTCEKLMDKFQKIAPSKGLYWMLQ